jgi:tetratricopeptide (TPR) repeat protein
MVDIDKKIKEARSKPPTADNANYIGDLYLKKGDRQKAMDFFYDAVDKLPYILKEKKIAIYKKIILNSPSDFKAYEGIIDIFSRMGIVVEEIKYLTVLAGILHEKGEHDKACSIYRKLIELEPQNKIAENYLLEFGGYTKETQDAEVKITEEQVKAESEQLKDLTAIKEIINNETEESLLANNTHIEIKGPEGISVKEDIQGEEKGTISKVKDRAEVGLFSASIEEAVDEEKSFYTYETRKTNKRVYVYAGISVLFIFVGIAFFMLYGKSRDDAGIDGGIEKAWINNNTELKIKKYSINVTIISENLMKESELSREINQEDIQKNQFFSVSIKAIKGCLPVEFVSSPHKMTSFIGKSGLKQEITEINGLNDLNKIIYRANLCDKEFAAVFIKFFISHDKGLNYNGLSFEGLEKGHPVLIRWG